MKGSHSLRWAGAALLLTGALTNPWSLARLFAPDGSISADYKLACIAAFETFCALSGMALILRRPRPWFEMKKSRWRLVGTAASLAVASMAVGLSIWGYRAYNAAHRHTAHMGHMGHHMEATEEQRKWAVDFYVRSLEAAKRKGWFDFETARKARRRR